ncbi:MAG: hypothetical protein ACKVRO_14620 [Micropepsaceae bacterium]
MRSDQNTRFGLALVGALVVHVLVLVGLAFSISFQPLKPPVIERQIVAVVAAPPPPPPPDVETFASEDAPVMVPRFRPRQPVGVAPERRQRFGDPALAVWRHLCNRDPALGEAVQRACPEDFGTVDLSVRDPLNRQGDSGIMLGNDSTTMSLEEAGRKKGWVKPASPFQANGARAKPNDLGLPGEDPFAILPK